MSKKPIFITGSHRSGSTWTGKMLSLTHEVGYIHEPFNFAHTLTPNRVPMVHWFECLNSELGKPYEPAFREMLDYQFPLLFNLKRALSVKDAALAVRECLRWEKYKKRGSRPLIKDPIGFYSTEWVAQEFNSDVVVMIRHPAAFCSSLKVKGWNFDFSQFLDQRYLIEEYLSEFEASLMRAVSEKLSVIEQAILLWNCVHSVIRQYQEKYPEWIFIRHEDLSYDPITQFNVLYDKLGLTFDHDIEVKIREATQSSNILSNKKENHKRNSRENIFSWKGRLTEEEICLIQASTRSICEEFYGCDEW